MDNLVGQRFIVSGTDTDIGKTVVSAFLVAGLKAHYWKPVQSGMHGATDSTVMARIGKHSDLVIHNEAYRLKMPASPHLAAENEGLVLDASYLDRQFDKVTAAAKQVAAPLIIEGAGGLMVPFSRSIFLIDIFARWQVPVILVARAGLGTLNHTLLSLEAMRKRALPIYGVVLVGEGHPDNAKTIATMGEVKILARIPILENLQATGVARLFSRYFKRADFAFPAEGNARQQNS